MPYGTGSYGTGAGLGASFPQTVTANAPVSTGEAFGTPQVIPHIMVVGIPSQEVVPDPFYVGNAISPHGMLSEETFGVIRITPTVEVLGNIGTAEAFGTPAVRHIQKVLPSSVPSGLTFGTAEIIRVDIIKPVGIGSDEVVADPIVIFDQTVAPISISGEESVGQPFITEAWWNPNWIYRRKLRLTTHSDDVQKLHPVEYIMPLDVTLGLGKMRDDYKDVRAVYFDQTVDPPVWRVMGYRLTPLLDDLLVEWNLKAVLPANTEFTGLYYVYYGNPDLVDLPELGYNNSIKYNEIDEPYDIAFVPAPWPTKIQQDNHRVAYTHPERDWKDGVSNVRWATATFEFSGGDIRLIANKDPYQAIAEVQIDDGDWEAVDLFSLTTQSAVEVYSKMDLTPGTHRIRVRVSGRRNPKAFGDSINIVRFEYFKHVVVEDLGEETYSGLRWAANTGGN